MIIFMFEFRWFWIGLFVEANTAVKKKVEDVMPIATGHEREELEAELQVDLLLSCYFIYTFESRNKEMKR